MGWTNGVRGIVLALLVVVAITTAGCAAVAGIFKAGMWVGIVVTVLVLAVVVFLFSRLGGR